MDDMQLPVSSLSVAVMQTLSVCCGEERELSQKTQDQWIFVPTLTHGHELWVVTKRKRPQMQTAEMSFLCSTLESGGEFQPSRETESRVTAPPHEEEPVEVTHVVRMHPV